MAQGTIMSRSSNAGSETEWKSSAWRVPGVLSNVQHAAKKAMRSSSNAVGNVGSSADCKQDAECHAEILNDYILDDYNTSPRRHSIISLTDEQTSPCERQFDASQRSETKVTMLPAHLKFELGDPAAASFDTADNNCNFVSFSIYDILLDDEAAAFNVPCILRFCDLAAHKIQAALERGVDAVFWSKDSPCDRLKSAFMIAAYFILKLDLKPDEVMSSFGNITSSPFKDLPDIFPTVSLEHAVRGLHTARMQGWLQLEMENDDLQVVRQEKRKSTASVTHVVPGKFVIYTGESAECCPADCIQLKAYDVQSVVRLGETKQSTAGMGVGGSVPVLAGLESIEVHDIPYGEHNFLPSPQTVQQFVEVCRRPGAVAIQCNEGLGRAGTLIAAWLILFKNLSAPDAIVWLQLARPGSIVGPQPGFLMQLEKFAAGCTIGHAVAKDCSSLKSKTSNGAQPARDPKPQRRGSGVRPDTQGSSKGGEPEKSSEAAAAVRRLQREVERLRTTIQSREEELERMDQALKASATALRREKRAAAAAATRASADRGKVLAAGGPAAAEAEAMAAAMRRLERRGAIKDAVIAMLLLALVALLFAHPGPSFQPGLSPGEPALGEAVEGARPADSGGWQRWASFQAVSGGVAAGVVGRGFTKEFSAPPAGAK